MQNTPLLQLKNINQFYTLGNNQQLQVLFDINLDVYTSDFIAIKGPSGSGKSTLMNILGCMDTPKSGEYYLAQNAIHTANDRELTKIRNKHIGFIFQKYQLINKYTVLQNVILPLLIRGIPRNDAIEMSQDTLNLLGLQTRLKHKPNELSGGQQQRVSIARALVGKPAILLADEPTGALDSKTGEDVLALFKELNSLGNTIVMITHDQHVADQAKKQMNIIDGKLYQ